MKNIKDKVISEKLRGLDTLPPGYEPNLDSKWELLEAAIFKRKDSSKRLVYIWMSTAASLLIVCSLGVKFYFNQDKKSIEQEKVISLIPLPNKRQSPGYFSEHKKIRENSVKIQTPVVPSPGTSHIHIAKDSNQLLCAQKNTDLLQKDSVIENPGSEIIKTSVSSQFIPAKKNKQRYIQVDFGDIAKQSIVPREQAALSLSFRVNVFGSEEEGETNNNNSIDKSLVLFKLNINR